MVHDPLANPEMNHPANPSIPKLVTTIAVFLIFSVFILLSSIQICTFLRGKFLCAPLR